jgi:hypothetical protein
MDQTMVGVILIYVTLKIPGSCIEFLVVMVTRPRKSIAQCIHVYILAPADIVTTHKLRLAISYFNDE